MTFELNRKLVDGLAPSPTLGATGPPLSPAQQHAKSPHSDWTHRKAGPFNAKHRWMFYSNERVVNHCTVSSSKKDGNGILSFIFLLYFLCWGGTHAAILEGTSGIEKCALFMYSVPTLTFKSFFYFYFFYKDINTFIWQGDITFIKSDKII